MCCQNLPEVITWKAGNYYFKHHFQLRRATMSDRYTLRIHTPPRLPSMGAAVSYKDIRRRTRRDSLQITCPMCTTHLPTCTTAPIWLKRDDRQACEHHRKGMMQSVRPDTKNTSCISVVFSHPDTPETIMASDYAD